jgi:hypothetical protein
VKTIMATRNFWQIGGGPVERSYAREFLRHGVGLIGPGDPGKWTPDRDDQDFECGSVRHFANEVSVGDVFVLRSGNARIQGIGVVASDYMYLDQFDDVNGWDLQHARRVRWYELPQEHDFGFPIFGANPRRLSRVGHADVLQFAERFVNSAPNDWQTATLPQLPPEAQKMETVPSELADVVSLVQDLGYGLYWDRQRFGEHPGEDEIIAHLVVPFLRALGWPSELVAIKWRYIDLALFRQLPRTPENCAFIVEAKQLGAGVEGAVEQARGYARTSNIACDLVVTDGVRYRMYDHTDEYRAVAYANLGRLKITAAKLFDRLKRP